MMQVILEDVRFFARHGVFEQERVCGNEFSVNLTVSLPYPCDLSVSTDDENPEEENLDVFISYADLYAIVEKEMKRPRKLLETVAVAIAREVKTRYPEIESGSVKITKIIPPIPGMDGKASVNFIF